MTKLPILAAGVAATIALMANGAQAQSGKASKADQKFMTEAIQGDLSEIEMGKLAQQIGTSDQVKQFGQKLISDHSANLDKAKSLAQSMGMTPPNAPSAKQTASHDRMSKLSGARFDRAFAKDMVEDHKNDIKAFRKESKKSGQAADFAKQTLPTLQQHLQIAQSLNKTGAKTVRTTTGSAH